MKILTWNVYRKNKNIEGIMGFIVSSEADVVCLQEFPSHFVDRLHALEGYHHVIEEETFALKDSPNTTVRMMTVLLSKYPIVHHGTVPHKDSYVSDAERKRPMKYSYFHSDSLYIDINAEGKKFRVFNAHLRCVAGPHHRLSQFKELLAELSEERENIVCGDFNTFGWSALNFVLWKPFGYRRNELFINERRSFDTVFEEYGFQNPFKGRITFLSVPAQLDYILVTKETSVASARRFLNTQGSDHVPLLLEI